MSLRLDEIPGVVDTLATVDGWDCGMTFTASFVVLSYYEQTVVKGIVFGAAAGAAGAGEQGHPPGQQPGQQQQMLSWM